MNLQAAAPFCGELHKVYDFKADSQFLEIVEQHHFTPEVENLRHGNTSTVGGDLSYTLMIFPNHYRALAAFSKLSLRDKALKPEGSKYSVGCFFDRAIRFKPNDAIIRMIFGNYLSRAGQPDKAVEQFQIAINLEPENPTVNYNLGLLYVKKKDYKQAKTYAKKAYELGFPLPGLKNQLIQAGKWDGD
jgi:tetratricopeptide (TPR) repeat protein